MYTLTVAVALYSPDDLAMYCIILVLRMTSWAIWHVSSWTIT